jgi:hypothetical protein
VAAAVRVGSTAFGRVEERGGGKWGGEGAEGQAEGVLGVVGGVDGVVVFLSDAEVGPYGVEVFPRLKAR